MATASLIPRRSTGKNPPRKSRRALQDFVEKGGQVIFTGARIQAFFPKAQIDEIFRTGEWKTFSADVPSNYTAGAPKIVLQTGGYLAGARQANQRPLHMEKHSLPSL